MLWECILSLRCKSELPFIYEIYRQSILPQDNSRQLTITHTHTQTINKLKQAKHYDPVKDGERSLAVGKVGSVVSQSTTSAVFPHWSHKVAGRARSLGSYRKSGGLGPTSHWGARCSRGIFKCSSNCLENVDRIAITSYCGIVLIQLIAGLTNQSLYRTY